MAVTVGDICKIILAVILPPLGVFAEKERCDKDVLINILLTVLGYIPGSQHYQSVVSLLAVVVQAEVCRAAFLGGLTICI